jgi:hypothetical protein
MVGTFARRCSTLAHVHANHNGLLSTLSACLIIALTDVVVVRRVVQAD